MGKLFGVAMVALFGLVMPLRAAESLSTFWISGQPAPGMPAGVNFSTPLDLHRNASGRLVLWAQVSGPGVNSANRDGVWAGFPGSLQLLARTSDAAPESGGAFFTPSQFFHTSIGNTGDVALIAQLGAVPSSATGVYSTAPGGGTLHLIARTGDPAPGFPAGVTLNPGVAPVQIADGGDITFFASLSGGGYSSFNASTLYTGFPGNYSLTVHGGDPYPGAPAGEVFGGALGPVRNQSGGFAFISSIAQLPSTPNFSSALWIGTLGSYQMVARQGTAAPGTPPGVIFGSLIPPVTSGIYPPMGNGGHVALRAPLTGTGVDGTNDSGLWRASVGEVKLLAREGDAAPGTAPGVVFGPFSTSRVDAINDAGAVAFQTTVTGVGVTTSNDVGIWACSSLDGVVRLIAREGDVAPDTPAGSVFSFVDLPMISSTGRTAFNARVSGPGVDSAHDQGLWMTDITGALHAVLREGDLFDVDPGPGVDLRTISGTILIPDTSGNIIDANGTMTISLTFAGAGDGVFTIASPVPEPAGAPAACLGAASILLAASSRSRYIRSDCSKYSCDAVSR
jgi:hypothetical protein